MVETAIVVFLLSCAAINFARAYAITKKANHI